MSRGTAAIFAATALLALAAVGIWWKRERPTADQTSKPTAAVVEVVGEPAPDSAVAATLYFPGPRGKLYPEEREVPAEETLEQRIATVVNQLLDGPAEEDLHPPLPAEVTLGGIYITSERIAFVDLDTPPDMARPPWGSKREMLAVYSLVDTVLLNFTEVESVVLLWNGQQRATFAGHLDTTRQLRPNRSLLARRSGTQ